MRDPRRDAGLHALACATFVAVAAYLNIRMVRVPELAPGVRAGLVAGLGALPVSALLAAVGIGTWAARPFAMRAVPFVVALACAWYVAACLITEAQVLRSAFSLLVVCMAVTQVGLARNARIATAAEQAGEPIPPEVLVGPGQEPERAQFPAWAGPPLGIAIGLGIAWLVTSPEVRAWGLAIGGGVGLAAGCVVGAFHSRR